MNIFHLAVEKKRRQMMDVANLKGMSSSETVKISQELDRLINLYFLSPNKTDTK
ncbi:aspartyl-phosphate phosphatase Spo0E family protein [Sutcliffiella cohnii]|uniref:aspartyl-phosphate phosphatase Spo0E family protein n=1 Tax=Sutcliffiella cohnii TaxID=33932 RepID=UPI00399D6577